MIRLIGLENSKAVHHIHVDGAHDFSYIGWSRNQTKKGAAAANGDTVKQWRNLFGNDATLDGTDNLSDVLDLPHELIFLEIETALPKISALPVSGGTGQASLIPPGDL